jgi:hypothetical protein
MADHEELLGSILLDLRAGEHDPELMDKYQLSYAELRALYQELFESGMLRDAVLHDSSPPVPGTQSPVPVEPELSLVTTWLEDDIRELQRCAVDFDVPVYDIDRPEVHGKVRNITERGVGITGIEADIDEKKTLVVLGDEFGEVSPFEFEAVCRWVSRDGTRPFDLIGFEITRISEWDMTELRKLMEYGIS